MSGRSITNRCAPAEENTHYIVRIALVATIGGFLFGFDSGVVHGAIDGLQQAFGSTSVGIGFEVGSMLIGCAIGASLAGAEADRMGRRGVLVVAAIFFLVSALAAGT